MALQFFNTLTQDKQPFEPAQPDRVRIYSCGPTVYNFNHLGNFRAYIFVDLLRRYLRARGYGLDHAMNITDVEDKIIANAKQAGKSIDDFTADYVRGFLEDLEYLGIENVEHRPRATRSIPAMLELLEHLDSNGHSYSADGNLYFRLGSFEGYGALAKLDTQNLKAAADGRFAADEYTKEDARDFALWKAASKDEPGWDSPWGYGRPGWHLECSAMIREIFGESGVDIHTGGIDLVFPHHENEIAQSCCAYPNDSFVKTWLHNEHLLVDGKKMSKSLGNYYMLRDFSQSDRLAKKVKEGSVPSFVEELSQKGRLARSLRYLLLSFHYRTKLNFTFENLRAADSACERLQGLVDRLLVIAEGFQGEVALGPQTAGQGGDHLKAHPGIVGRTAALWLEALDDDLNTARALASLFDFARDLNPRIEANAVGRTEALAGLEFLSFANQLLGVLRFTPAQVTQTAEPLPGEITELIEERRQARANKDFAKSDSIRDDLLARGIRLVDTPSGTTWEKVAT